MKLFRSIFLGITLSAVALGSASAKPGWLTDYKQAQEEAKTSKKLLLMDFTGSDWCGWCIKLEREVFSKPEFQEYAKKNLILLEIDFPRGKEQPTEQKIQNQQLGEAHGIQGFPTLVLLDSEGKKVGELFYTPGGPSAFIAELEKLKKG